MLRRYVRESLRNQMILHKVLIFVDREADQSTTTSRFTATSSKFGIGSFLCREHSAAATL
jgi:hypothetical protein